ncbi:MAG: NADH:flavin oxidoreductase/NADH oxidase family protein [Bacteroidota bacterium]
MTKINESFTLPCGVVLKNRLAKAAMTERMANPYQEPTELHSKLYKKWSDTGAGLLITGNVLVDRDHLESAGNVCFDEKSDLDKLRKWASSVNGTDSQLWVQLSHAGRQTNRFTNTRPLAPSSVQLQKMGLFGKPKSMTENEILEVIEKFRVAAGITKEAGFSGIQIHAAHGYLLSQFLSPATNKRDDKWGGNLENRSRLLREILREVRTEVGSDFPISVKLNSADFQRGGFDESDSLEVVKMLEAEGVDLLEISGGTYEKVAFFIQDDSVRESTKQREAYFLDFAKKIREVSKIPIMVTGGFRTSSFCNEALANGDLDLVGMGRPFLTDVDRISGLLKGEEIQLNSQKIRSAFSSINDSAEGGFYARQVLQLAEKGKVKENMNPLACAMFLIYHEFTKGLKRKASKA